MPMATLLGCIRAFGGNFGWVNPDLNFSQGNRAWAGRVWR